METEPGDRALETKACEFVTAVLDSAHSALSCPSSDSNDTEPGYQTTNIDWVSCGEFTIERGRAQIEEYMRTWEVHPNWLFSVQFLQEKELKFKRQFHYRALWSLPTRRSPVPRGTAAVYFIIETSKIKAQTLPVEVRFVVESTRTLHVPGKTRFREKWLKDVIESKALLLDAVDF
ncbi:A-kinase anchor protein 14 [Colossoma macropomum]|uniref:A-kinase anchor protein 14 n=1 Tax=Colossoma macropomum TaxID=42526 RepID=UPI001864E85F|nr:A-kinase anchor protein 14 [Colossoma macropomum]